MKVERLSLKIHTVYTLAHAEKQMWTCIRAHTTHKTRSCLSPAVAQKVSVHATLQR